MGDPTIEANNAKMQQIYQDMLEYSKQQAEVNYARNQGAFVAGQGIRAAGNAGVAAINYLGDWQKIANGKEENAFAAANGLDAPNGYFPDLGSYGNDPSEDNWQQVNDAMNGVMPDEMQAAQDLMNSNKP